MTRLTIIAGANGAGKSTLTKRLLLHRGERLGHILDPDAVARKLNPIYPEQAALSAGKEVLRLLQQYLANGERIFYETTMSDKNRHLRLIEQAKGLGYKVTLLYVGLNSADQHRRRVDVRVLQGLHNVPDEDIRRRFERSRANLAPTLQVVDAAMVYDNSSRNMQLVASVRLGKIRRLRHGGWWSPLLGELEKDSQ
jgi:predicted ABC-type ATPase